jgi:hypothetical protein
LQAGEPLVPTPAPLLHAMRALRLRYFTPAEIAALHGFPRSFRFGARLQRPDALSVHRHVGHGVMALRPAWLSL